MYQDSHTQQESLHFGMSLSWHPQVIVGGHRLSAGFSAGVSQPICWLHSTSRVHSPLFEDLVETAVSFDGPRLAKTICSMLRPVKRPG